MEITVNTKHDSKDEIKKVVALLMSIVADGKDVHMNEEITDMSPPQTLTQGSLLSNLFDNQEVKLPQELPQPLPPAKKQPEPKIEFY